MAKKKTKPKKEEQRRTNGRYQTLCVTMTRATVRILDRIAKAERRGNRSATLEDMVKRTYTHGRDLPAPRDLLHDL